MENIEFGQHVPGVEQSVEIQDSVEELNRKRASIAAILEAMGEGVPSQERNI